jgi:hypothetical protein
MNTMNTANTQIPAPFTLIQAWSKLLETHGSKNDQDANFNNAFMLESPLLATLINEFITNDDATAILNGAEHYQRSYNKGNIRAIGIDEASLTVSVGEQTMLTKFAFTCYKVEDNVYTTRVDNVLIYLPNMKSPLGESSHPMTFSEQDGFMLNNITEEAFNDALEPMAEEIFNNAKEAK